MTDNFDFSQLKSFKTPENWIEAAINIPQKKKPLPFILRPYVIGTAASLVIVAAAVLTILLSSGGKPPLGNEHHPRCPRYNRRHDPTGDGDN